MSRMNIDDPTSFRHCSVEDLNGIRIHYIDENPSSKKVLLLLHGFPDLWFGMSFLLYWSIMRVTPYTFFVCARAYQCRMETSNPVLGFERISSDCARPSRIWRNCKLRHIGLMTLSPRWHVYFQSSPESHEVYGHKTVSDDLVALLDYLQIPTVTVLAHDWYVALSIKMQRMVFSLFLT